MAQRPISVPVLPRPALQCRAMADELVSKCESERCINSFAMLSGGVDPSIKYKSLCLMLQFSKYYLL